MYEFPESGGLIHFNNADPTKYIVDAEGDVYADFHGAGMWMHNATTGVWMQLTPVDSTQFLATR